MKHNNNSKCAKKQIKNQKRAISVIFSALQLSSEFDVRTKAGAMA
ncbi:hypothetical protein CSC17_1476 [Klebsiella oxytoca]|nr:hypothetical protein CSC17_1476 [Klebsiella oxytoca]